METLIHASRFDPSNYPKKPAKNASFGTMKGLKAGISTARM
jgi:hypothetical protein